MVGKDEDPLNCGQFILGEDNGKAKWRVDPLLHYL
jgi:hypothetical protein